VCEIRAGNAAMYYPEANVLVPATVDPQSRTPAFKSVPVTLHPDNGASFVQIKAIEPQGSSVPRRLNAC
jgi:hypothetical protein